MTPLYLDSQEAVDRHNERVKVQREAFSLGFAAAKDHSTWEWYDATIEAHRLWPDPVPPSAMTVREEPDPYDTDTAWRWQPGEGVQYRNRALPSPWVVPPHLEFSDDSYSIARLALLADLAAFPMRLPDGRPCTLTGEAKP